MFFPVVSIEVRLHMTTDTQCHQILRLDVFLIVVNMVYMVSPFTLGFGDAADLTCVVVSSTNLFLMSSIPAYRVWFKRFPALPVGSKRSDLTIQGALWAGLSKHWILFALHALAYLLSILGVLKMRQSFMPFANPLAYFRRTFHAQLGCAHLSPRFIGVSTVTNKAIGVPPHALVRFFTETLVPRHPTFLRFAHLALCFFCMFPYVPTRTLGKSAMTIPFRHLFRHVIPPAVSPLPRTPLRLMYHQRVPVAAKFSASRYCPQSALRVTRSL